MKKRIYKLMSFVLCAVMAASLSLTALAADGSSASAAVEDPEYYGRAALSLLDNSEALLYAYDSIVKGVENVSAKITVYNGVDSFSVDEFYIVLDAYMRDYTQHFWFNSVPSGWFTDTGILSAIAPEYTMTGSELSKARAEFDEAVNFMISGIDATGSDFEKEKILHDRLAAAVTYVKSESAQNKHNAYGALVEGEAVCDGYAEAYQYLLRKVGIQSFIAFGSSIEPSTNNLVGHAWNYVRIDGKYYHVDVTWDDTKSVIHYAYLNISDDLITEDHYIDEAEYPLPICNSDEKYYFTSYGEKLSNNYTANEIANILNRNQLANGVYVARFYIPFEKNLSDDVSRFLNWFFGDPDDNSEHKYDNYYNVLSNMGVTAAYTSSGYCVGREVMLTVSKVLDGAVSGQISSWDGTDNVIVKLYDGAVSDEEIRADMKFGTPQKAFPNIFVATELSLSNNKYYQAFEFQNLAAGNYKVAFFKPGGHVVDIKSVSVGDSSVTDINADMQKCGDINNDGNFNSLDLSGLRKALLNASEKTQACDANRSGTIDIIDLIRLKKFASSAV